MGDVERRELVERIGRSVDGLGRLERIHAPRPFVGFERGILRRLTGSWRVESKTRLAAGGSSLARVRRCDRSAETMRTKSSDGRRRTHSPAAAVCAIGSTSQFDLGPDGILGIESQRPQRRRLPFAGVHRCSSRAAALVATGDPRLKISTILDKIDEKQLFVPAFQREYVWKRDDAKELIDSLVKEYPTGTLLLWETASPPELKGPHKYDAKQGAVRLILDGQQRATTLYMLIKGELPPYYTAADITNDTRGLYVNLETRELAYFQKMRMGNNPLWQNITDVFQGKVDAFNISDKLTAAGKESGTEVLRLLNANINAVRQIREREFPEQTIPVKATIREAIDIFYKVNASGVALTEAELALAQISGYWPQARDLFKAKLADLEANGFVLKLDWLMYVLLGCLYHGGSEMRRLHDMSNRDALQAAWKLLDTQVLDYVVNLLRNDAYVDHTAEINSIYALVPILVYCHDKGGQHLTRIESRKVIKWFYYSQIRTRYTSQLPQKLDRDLRALTESDEPFDDLLQVIAEEEGHLRIEPYEFEGRAIQHPLFSMVRWFVKSRGAVCFTTGMTLRQNMGKRYQLELDHIFPYSKLKRAGFGIENRVKYSLAQEFTNRAILTQIANRAKSNTDAAEYLAGVEARFPGALELQCVPPDPELWPIESYEEFLKTRRALLAEHLNVFLDRITRTGEVVVPVTLEQEVAEGESAELEFKSTLRWDLTEQVVNKRLEAAVLKAVAAFANSQGGSLLIGVDDNGQLVGLEHDYATLGDVDRDGFELHLRNLMNQAIGTAFVAKSVSVTFPPLGDGLICRVVVRPAQSPLFLRTVAKDGQASERFYVRSGNSSQEIPSAQLKEYWDQRFT